MDPVKKDGKIREQIEIEHQVRRRYDTKWGGQIPSPSMLHALYSPDHIHSQLQATDAASSPDSFTGHGQSYGWSAQMYNAMQAVCRCGRPKDGVHRLRCLRAPPPKVPSKAKKPADGGAAVADNGSRNVPRTSLGMYGWPAVASYAQMQHATRYVSPTNDIPGGRLRDRPNESIFIG